MTTPPVFLEVAMETVPCPYCHALFPRVDAAFVLARHVTQCALKAWPAPVDEHFVDAKHCPICWRVFDEHVKPFEIVLHEEECERVNGSLKKVAHQKRRRVVEMSPPSSAPSSKTRPSPAKTKVPEITDASTPLCFLCGQGGRQLLSCSGSCTRSFHIACIGESASLVHRPYVAQRRSWKCAECFRGIHMCFKCDMVGDDDMDSFKCSISGCGVYAHQRCMSKGQDPSLFVCPRHACSVCKKQGLAQADALHCYQCPTALHKACHSTKSPSFTALVGHHGCCGHHSTLRTVSPSLRSKLHVGDVVLVLNFGNSHLPLEAKQLHANQWGRVLTVEGIEFSAQLLTVALFACDLTLTLTNQHAVPVTTPYEPTKAFVQNCITIHLHTELSLRGLSPASMEAERSQLVMDSVLAFQHLAQQLAISPDDVIEMATLAYESWRVRDKTRPKNVFGVLDTRRRVRPSSPKKAPTRQSARASTRASSMAEAFQPRTISLLPLAVSNGAHEVIAIDDDDDEYDDDAPLA
ncbi:hypothetical protein SDRG_15234 [Saprolegnia diclina VS20]|uniref:PHD-type domain-containing protein n=1 Tax=Saprolegnia diclina (strain VS20) TaxID=1156394 RepID=T0PXD0_SAPDV|nr:hypothetical protein SDRG_15234 [Saprolegnia diclina VS20]EQC26901.1 hypothetical protein SDRG_15234 [Saprolegnia diclina VS20]|eukprot:XP_008619622.1 hypothetical protein SDRG_15234 [Saprolegnia diclina VS20]